jgi:hypothetical protein
MPVSLEFLRGALGMLCVLFAHMGGRSGAAVHKGQQKVSRLYAWVLRALVCAIGVALRHPVDGIDLGVWVLSAAAFGLGWWDATREKKTEDLTREIFPQ